MLSVRLVFLTFLLPPMLCACGRHMNLVSSTALSPAAVSRLEFDIAPDVRWRRNRPRSATLRPIRLIRERGPEITLKDVASFEIDPGRVAVEVNVIGSYVQQHTMDEQRWSKGALNQSCINGHGYRAEMNLLPGYTYYLWGIEGDFGVSISAAKRLSGTSGDTTPLIEGDWQSVPTAPLGERCHRTSPGQSVIFDSIGSIFD